MPLVLIIDADPEIRRMLRLILEIDGHAVVEADTQAKGIDLYRHQPADLVICDVETTTPGPLEFVRQCPGVRVVAMCADAVPALQLGLQQATQALGAFRLLGKPFTLQSFLDAVREGLAV